ncbi:unnamed protein product, partial [Prorocentrum cordatum]
RTMRRSRLRSSLQADRSTQTSSRRAAPGAGWWRRTVDQDRKILLLLRAATLAGTAYIALVPTGPQCQTCLVGLGYLCCLGFLVYCSGHRDAVADGWDVLLGEPLPWGVLWRFASTASVAHLGWRTLALG